MKTYGDEPSANLVTFDNRDFSLNSLVIATSRGNIVIHCDTGEVEYPDSLSDVAREFWLALESAYPLLFESRAKEGE